jgi:hypothetical protein
MQLYYGRAVDDAALPGSAKNTGNAHGLAKLPITRFCRSRLTYRFNLTNPSEKS